MEKDILMIRLGSKFLKESIQNVEVANFRIISNGRKKEYETDYFFEFNGKHYRSNEHICRSSNGKLIKPVCFKHELVCLD